MFSFCRLCAKWMDGTDLSTELCELQPKLTFCCNWKPSPNEEKMPKKVCYVCVERLESCWNFTKSIWAAEKQLNKLILEAVEAITEEITTHLQEIKSEPTMPKLKDFSILLERADTSTLVDNNSAEVETEIDAAEYGGGGDDDDVFGEPISYSDDGCVEPIKSNQKENTNKKRKKGHVQKDIFLSNLTPKDMESSGLVSENGIKKLEEILPNMKTISWNDCQYKCDKCDRIFQGPNNYYAHIRSIHSDEAMSINVPCFYCNTKHRRDHALNKHIASEHFVHLKYRCLYCSDYYWKKLELTKHQKLHTNVEIICELCGQAFANRNVFCSHITMNHMKKNKVTANDEKFICDLCKKEFTTKGGIRNHMLLHTDKFDYVCHICGWKFQAKGNLKEHLACAHTTHRAFKCNCGKRFKTKHQLNNHAKAHSDPKKFQCELCGRKFRRPYTLTVHMRSHTKSNPYTCRYCGKSFRHNITLQTHERAHTDDKPYPCPICEYRSTAKGNLNKHMMRVHSIDYRNHLHYPEDKIQHVQPDTNM